MRHQPQLAAVKPFRALHFNPRRVRFEDVVAPPFDVITPEQQSRLEARSAYNVVRVILPREGEEPAAARMLCDWQRDGVLAREQTACFYWVEQDFVAPDTTRQTRGGLIGLVRLEPYARRVVLPHEQTRDAPVASRMALLAATRTHLSAVFALYHDPSQTAERALRAHRDADVSIDVTDEDGTRHRLWRVTSGHETVAAVVAQSRLLIADGHHRYKSALRYAEQHPHDTAAGWVLMYLTNADADGVAIYPTHRVVRGVADRLAAALTNRGLRVVDAGDDPAGMLAACGRNAGFVLLEHDAPARLVTLDQPGLDAALLQDTLLSPILGLDAGVVAQTDRISYVHQEAQARSAVRAGTAAMLVRPPSIGDVEDAALEGRMMPPKTTFFYPKTVDGFVFYEFDECRD